MGGLQTLYAGIKNTDMFSYLGVFSSGWFANQPALSDPQYDFMKDNAATINNNLKSVLDCAGWQRRYCLQQLQDYAWQSLMRWELSILIVNIPADIHGRYGETTCTILHKCYLNKIASYDEY